MKYISADDDFTTFQAEKDPLPAEDAQELCECGKPITISDQTKPGDAAWGGMCEDCAITETLRRT